MDELERPSSPSDRLAESVRRALQLVGPAESGPERAGDETPVERPAA